jgi:hypothetical protein
MGHVVQIVKVYSTNCILSLATVPWGDCDKSQMSPMCGVNNRKNCDREFSLLYRVTYRAATLPF